jgi:hypothetical protein
LRESCLYACAVATEAGRALGKIRIGKDFDAPLPDEILASFDGTATKATGPQVRLLVDTHLLVRGRRSAARAKPLR